MTFKVIAVGLLVVVAIGLYVGFTMTPQQKSAAPATGNPVLDGYNPPAVLNNTTSLNASPEAVIASNGSAENESPQTNGTPVIANTSAKNKTIEPVLTLFWGAGCPHCAAEKAFLNGISGAYPQLKIVMYEANQNESNLELFRQWCSEWNVGCDTVPMTFMGNRSFTNFMDYDGPLTYHSTKRAYMGYRNQIENAIREVLGLPSENRTDWTTMSVSVKTDKEVYYNRDPMNITVVVNSPGYATDCVVAVKGLEGPKRFYVDSQKTVNLNKGNTTVLFKETAPQCFSCGGFRPGSYEIRAWVEKDGEIMDDAVITVRIEDTND